MTRGLQAKPIVRESQDFAWAALDALCSNICVLDESGTIIFVNRAWREFADANAIVRAADDRNDALCKNSTGEGADYLGLCDRLGSEGMVP